VVAATSVLACIHHGSENLLPFKCQVLLARAQMMIILVFLGIASCLRHSEGTFLSLVTISLKFPLSDSCFRCLVAELARRAFLLLEADQGHLTQLF